nr:hypothetical protein CFP56_53396 [Quercus suber]
MARTAPFSSHSNTWHRFDSILTLLNKWVDGMDKTDRINFQAFGLKVEEFTAILGCDIDAPPTVPSCEPKYQTRLSSLMRIPLKEVVPLLDGQWVDVQKIIDKFMPMEFLLFTGDHGFPNVRVADIAHEAANEKNIVPIVLAETFHGLDALSNQETVLFHGSPLLLQIWLMDHLSLVLPPTMSPYGLEHYRGCSLKRTGYVTEQD